MRRGFRPRRFSAHPMNPLLKSIPIFIFTMLLFSGCTTYKGTMGKIAVSAEAGRFAEARDTLDKSPLAASRKDRLLYLLEKGTLLQMAKDYKDSNDVFESAERQADEFYGISISNELKGAIVNDAMMEYPGEDFERVLIHYFRAMNYMSLENRDEALVECRKADNLLNQINERYQGKNVYKEDALLRYLSGMLYEWDHSYNDAFIAYRKAYDLYSKDYQRLYGVSAPPFLLGDLVRTAKASGLADEAEKYLDELGDAPWIDRETMDSYGELIILMDNGWAPRKERKDIFLPIPTSQPPLPIRFSVPQFRASRPTVALASVWVDDARAGRTYTLENIGAIAVKNLDDRIGRVVAKTIARIAAKQAALEISVRKIEKENGPTAGAFARLIMQAGLNLTEEADIRSWHTLPGEVQLARIPLPPGRHRVLVELKDRNGMVVDEEDMGEITAVAGQKVFRRLRSFR